MRKSKYNYILFALPLISKNAVFLRFNLSFLQSLGHILSCSLGRSASYPGSLLLLLRVLLLICVLRLYPCVRQLYSWRGNKQTGSLLSCGTELLLWDSKKVPGFIHTWHGTGVMAVHFPRLSTVAEHHTSSASAITGWGGLELFFFRLFSPLHMISRRWLQFCTYVRIYVTSFKLICSMWENTQRETFKLESEERWLKPWHAPLSSHWAPARNVQSSILEAQFSSPLQNR